MNGRVLGTAASYDDIHAILRARADELSVSRETIDAVAGTHSGYAAKVLAPRPIKKLGAVSTWLILSALGLELQIVETPESLARVAKMLAKRNDAQTRHSAAVLFRLSHRYLRKIAKKGGHNSRKNMGPRRRRMLARKAGLAGAAARWGKARATTEYVGTTKFPRG